jgi:hypothetical protein
MASMTEPAFRIDEEDRMEIATLLAAADGDVRGTRSGLVIPPR